MAEVPKVFLEGVLQGLGPRLRRGFSQPPELEALDEGLAAALATMDEALRHELGTHGPELMAALRASSDAGASFGAALRGRPEDLCDWLELATESQGQNLDAARLVSAAVATLAPLATQHPGLRAVLASSKAPSVGVRSRSMRAQNIVGGNQIIVEAAADRVVDSRSPWRAYLEDLIFLCRSLPLGALGDKRGLVDDITLDRVFIELETWTKAEAPKKETPRGRPRPGTQDDGIPGPFGPNSGEASYRLAREIAEEEPRLVLKGAPGGGKSCFVKELVARQAETLLAAAEAGEAAPKLLLPVFIELRELAPTLRDLPEEKNESRRRQRLAATLVEHAVQALAVTGRQDFGPALRRLAQDHLWMLVLDGLDEVASGLRSLVREAVGAAILRYKFPRVVVTCRVRSYTGETQLPGFAQAQLRPLDKDRIRAFAKAWYLAQGNRLSPTQMRDWGEDLATSAVASDLREMAENPMLLTAMALVHQERHRLPRKRARLYFRAVEVLFLRWQEQKHLEDPNEARLADVLEDENRRWRILQFLGMKAHEIRAQGQQQESGAELTEGFLIEHLKRPEFLGSAGLVEAFLDYVDKRAGILIGRGRAEGEPATYRFAHQTLQEYLAGRYLMDSGDRLKALHGKSQDGEFWNLPALLGAEDLLYQKQEEAQFVLLATSLNPEDAPQEVTEGFERGILWSGLMSKELGVERLEQKNARSHLQRLSIRLRDLLTSSLTVKERIEAGRLLGTLGEPDDSLTNVDKLELCWVPQGRFWFSGLAKEEDEGPQAGGWLKMPYPYWIGRFPVTQGQFGEFVKAGGYRETDLWKEAIEGGYWEDGKITLSWVKETRSTPREFGAPFDHQNHPVVGITWYEALAFCRWLTRRARDRDQIPETWQFCLPSEMEWEQAARGGEAVPEQGRIRSLEAGIGLDLIQGVETVPNVEETRAYPWGSDLETEESTGRGNFGGAAKTTSRPGTFPKAVSPAGCEELAGNVWEWSRSVHGKIRGEELEIEGMAEAMKTELEADGDEPRWILGGSYYNDSSSVGCSARLRLHPYYWNGNFGFRVVLLPFPSGL